jgi:hypothetical protein
MSAPCLAVPTPARHSCIPGTSRRKFPDIFSLPAPPLPLSLSIRFKIEMPTTKVTAAQFKQILVMRRTEVAQEKQRAEAARVSAAKIAMDEKVAIVHMNTSTDTQTHIHATSASKKTFNACIQHIRSRRKIQARARAPASSTLPSPSNRSMLSSVRDSRQRTFLHAPRSSSLIPTNTVPMNASQTDLSRLFPSVRA